MKTNVYATTEAVKDGYYSYHHEYTLYTTIDKMAKRYRDFSEYKILDVPLLFPFNFKINDMEAYISYDKDDGFVKIGEILVHKDYKEPNYINKQDTWGSAHTAYVQIYCLKDNIKEAEKEFKKLGKSEELYDNWFKIWNTKFRVDVVDDNICRKNWGESGN